ncbi:hypothetical protein KR009_004358, partial [Drosophila setifemur]
YRGKVFERNCFHMAEAQSKHSCEVSSSEEDFGYVPEYRKSTSSGSDGIQHHSQPSQRSSDRSKSFSQIYSEIFEESKERAEKAKRACLTYNINRSKLHRNHEKFGGPECGNYEGETSLGSDYSSPSAMRFEEYEYLSSVGSKDSVRSSDSKISAKEMLSSISSERNLELSSFRSEQEYFEEYSANRYIPGSTNSQQEISVYRKSSVYSSSKKFHLQSFNSAESCIKYKNDKSAATISTATSRSSANRDYKPSNRRSRRHHPHYHQDRSVLKTYQDRGNSPITIRTTRQKSECAKLHFDIDSKDSEDSSVDKFSVSVGIQYPSEDEAEVQLECPEVVGSLQAPDDNGQRKWSEEEEGSVIDQLVQKVFDDELRMPDRVAGKGSKSPETSDGDEKMGDCFNINMTSDEDVLSLHQMRVNSNGLEPKCTDECDQCVAQNSDRINPPNEYIEDEQMVFKREEEDVALYYESNPPLEKSEAMSKSPLFLRIYDADEALMEIPEEFEGSAIVLDDNADFLDITLTDDEEKIKAKLMAAALTTRPTSCSSSANSSAKSSRSCVPSIFSYRPSVIFTRRSEGFEVSAPRTDDRIALLAEQTLRVCSRQYTKWLPFENRVDTVPQAKKQLLESEPSKTQPCSDRQSLSQEFNRKLHRQLKVLAERFQ